MNFKEYQEHRLKIKTDPEYAKAIKDKEIAVLHEYWMNLKPFQVVEDVPELPVMNDFYKNRLIDLGAVTKNQLEDGVWYYGNYRNADFGRWNLQTQKFDHYRWKFGWMEDDCNHFEDDNGYALFVPLRKANETELIEIEKIIKEYESK